MKKIVILLFIALLMQAATFAQVRDTIFLDTALDSTLIDKATRIVGDEIYKRSISLTNRCNVKLDIKLSANEKTWKQFSIEAVEEKLFVTSKLDKIYLWIDPKRNINTKYIIYKGDQYEILWSSMEGNYMLKQK